jgi:hypothetical protein
VIDYEELAARSFDEQLDPDDQASLRVWADALEGADDPRGSLITMEFAIRDQPARRRELTRAMNVHLAERAAPMFAGITPLLHDKRALELDWRSGRLYGASIDTRYIADKADLAPHKLVSMLLKAPATAGMRRLHVRVRRATHVDPVLRIIAKSKRRHALEELAVMTGVRPRELGTYNLAARFRIEGAMVDTELPNLRTLVIDDAVVPFPAGDGAVAALEDATDPSDVADRRLIGRCLTAGDAVRDAALKHVAALGPAAFMFVDTLLVLLEPGLVAAQDTVVRSLPALGAAARSAVPRLAVITGRTALYDLATRQAAGRAIAALRV